MEQVTRGVDEPGSFEPPDKSEAALVPGGASDQIVRRAAFFDRMEQIAARTNLSPEDADALAQEAVEAVRAQSKP